MLKPLTYTFIINHETRLILIPSNESERLIISQLLEGEIELCQVSDKVNILGQNITGGVIVRKKNSLSEPRESKEEYGNTDRAEPGS